MQSNSFRFVKSKMPMNAMKLFLGLGLLLCSTLGCSPAELPFTDNSKDSAAFALSTKTLILNIAENIKLSKEPGDVLGGIVSSLSALDVSPTGEHLKTYQEIHALASALATECQNGKPAGFDGKLKAIADLAKTLPGDAKVEKEKSVSN